jgi:16S rRNA (uracil1498-N3)-methyltransferase
MRRFIVPQLNLGQGTVTISSDLHHHMTRVLRMKTGTRLILADGEGHEARGTVVEVGKESLTVELEGEGRSAAAEAGPRITLYQGLPKGDKLELIIQKGTELGVAAIIPFPTSRSVSRLDVERAEIKVARWQRIANEAARQSKRASLPRIAVAGNLAEVLRSATQSVKLLLWEEEGDNRLRSALAKLPLPESIAIIVGPEGGLSEEEVRQARESGFIPVSLGHRILRTETAGLALLAILQFHWGDMG